MGEVLIQVWLKSIKKLVNYWTNKWMHKKEFEMTFGVHTSSRKPMKKCMMKMKEIN